MPAMLTLLASLLALALAPLAVIYDSKGETRLAVVVLIYQTSAFGCVCQIIDVLNSFFLVSW